MSRQHDHDLIVLGAGAGGLAAARAGVRAGWRTALVTDGPPGGDCTFTGCVPSKTLLAAAAKGATSADAFAGVRAAAARIAATETADVLRGEGIDVREGRGRFAGPRTAGRYVVAVAAPDAGVSTVSAAQVVVATGSSPLVPDVAHGVGVLTTDTVFALDRAPDALAVLGGGPAGCELAQAFARLASRVTLLEARGRVLPGEEPDVGALIAEALGRDGVDVRTGATVTAVEGCSGGVRVVLGDGSPVDANRLLVGTGRRPDTDALGLDAAGVARRSDGAVLVDATLATTAAGVWAVGDVTGLSAHTHAADEMGRLAVGNARRARLPRAAWRRFRADLVPRVVFTDPEVATIGRTEEQAVGEGAWVAEVPMSAVDRAITAGREEGFVRLVAGPLPGTGHRRRPVAGGRLLGATVVAPRAGEMIAEVALAMRVGALTGRLAQTVHAYPTWSLAIRQAAAALATGDERYATLRPAREVDR